MLSKNFKINNFVNFESKHALMTLHWTLLECFTGLLLCRSTFYGVLELSCVKATTFIDFAHTYSAVRSTVIIHPLTASLY